MRMPRLPFFVWHFEVTGLNLERFIALLDREHIPLLGVQRTDARTLSCRCFAADVNSIILHADQKGWRIRTLKPSGLSAAAAFVKNRPGLPAGLLLACILLITLSGFVWRIDIHGAGACRADMAAYLARSGVRVGTPRSSIDARALEWQLSYRYPQFAWLHVYVSNMTLVVDAVQGVPVPQLPGASPADVVAVRDGVVEAVRVFSGTAAVRPGDTVQKGQVLIRGQERGSDGETVYVHAQGIVTARCFHSETVSIPLYEILSRETGREATDMRILTPWFSLAQQPDETNYLSSNVYRKEIPIGGCFFPVVLQLTTRREVAMEYAARNAEDVRREASEAACSRLKNALRGYEIIDKWVDYCMIEDESVSARATAEWLMDIGGTDPP